MLQKAFLGLSRNISILLFQKWYKKVPQNGENAYLVKKIQELPELPSQLGLTSFV